MELIKSKAEDWKWQDDLEVYFCSVMISPWFGRWVRVTTVNPLISISLCFVHRCRPHAEIVKNSFDTKWQLEDATGSVGRSSSYRWSSAVPKVMADMPDLSHLTPEERAIIENVMLRQKQEEETEKELMKWVNWHSFSFPHWNLLPPSPVLWKNIPPWSFILHPFVRI